MSAGSIKIPESNTHLVDTYGMSKGDVREVGLYRLALARATRNPDLFGGHL